jgi:predicted amidohydrolase YtcJ
VSVLFSDVEVDGQRTSVRVVGSRVDSSRLSGRVEPADVVVDGAGAALIPGLHDHHIHLAAIGAADRSLQLTGHDLDRALRDRHDALASHMWVRAVGYDERDHGPLDRHRLDALAPQRPVRVQHRSGALWVLSSAAMQQVGASTDHLFRADDWLHSRLPWHDAPDVSAVASRLATYGITGVTDATPSSSIEQVDLLAAVTAVRVHAMGGVRLAGWAFPSGVERGPVKVVIADHELPALDELADAITAAHEAGRPVAIHCVTRVALVLAVAAWDAVGSVPGDRVEHGAVVPPELAVRLAELNLTVVTQPAFVVARGDRYIDEVDAEDQPHLYPCASLLAAGVELGGRTDAPFGPEDPWVAIRAAIDRRTSGGAVLGADERLPARRALDLFLSELERPGGPPRRVEPGAPADLCLLDAPLDEVLREPDAGRVRMVMSRGVMTFDGTS